MHLDSRPVSARGSPFDSTDEPLFVSSSALHGAVLTAREFVLSSNFTALFRALYGLGDLMTLRTEGHDEWYAPLTKSQHRVYAGTRAQHTHKIDQER